MALVTLTRKAETIQGYQLTSPSDMMTALTTLAGKNYNGSIEVNASTYVLRIQSPYASTMQSAVINDWLILENNAIATVCPQADFAGLYQQG